MASFALRDAERALGPAMRSPLPASLPPPLRFRADRCDIRVRVFCGSSLRPGPSLGVDVSVRARGRRGQARVRRDLLDAGRADLPL